MPSVNKKKRAISKAIIVFLMGLITGLYLFWKHSNIVPAIVFIIAGLILSTIVYVVNRPR